MERETNNILRSTGKPRAFTWTFKSGLLGLIVLIAWAELLGHFGRNTMSAQGDGRWGYAIAFFFTLLPFFGLLSFRTAFAFHFFRSIKVGVLNLVLIGLGAMIGVLVHQENVDNPIPASGVASLNAWEEIASGETWSYEQQKTWFFYAGGGGNSSSFRNAQAFFLYHLLGKVGGDLWFNLDESLDVNQVEIQRRLDGLVDHIPGIRARFGEDLAVAIASQSRVGLETRADNRRISALEEKWNDSLWSFFVLADRLDFIRVYRSDWYSLLWAVLFLGVLSNTFRGGWRRLLKPGKWGFVITHSGILILVTGAFFGRMGEMRGILNLRVGDVGHEFQLYALSPEGRAQFRPFLGDSDGAPFALKLDAFRADQHDVLDVWYVKEGADHKLEYEFALDAQPKERVWQGLHLTYDRPISDPIDGTPALEITVLEYFPQAKVLSFNESLFPQKVDPVNAADFYSVAFPAALLRIQTNGTTLQEHWLSGDPEAKPLPVSYLSPDGEPRLLYLLFREDTSGQSLPFEWRSKLSVLRGPSTAKDVIRSGEIRVNDYLHYDGWRFFQTSHDPNDPKYSGIGVVYDPGMEAVLLGFWMVMLGTITVFLVNPIFTRKHRGTS